MGLACCGCRCVFSVLTIIICVILFLLSGWYWWYIDLAVTAATPDVTAIVLYAISGVLLIVMSIIGVCAIFKKSDNLICYFAIVMMVMFIFGIVQIGLTVYSKSQCNSTTGTSNSSGNPFSFICGLGLGEADVGYWIPTISILAGTLIGFIFAIILKCLWKKDDDKETYY